MIIDITGTKLTPGNIGKDCLGNGYHESIERCCDECNYLMCCIDETYPKNCVSCDDIECPRKS